MKPSFPPKSTPLTYCHLGRIALRADHMDMPADAPPEQILKALQKSPQLYRDERLVKATGMLVEAGEAERRRRVITLTGPDQRPFSLIYLNVDGGPRGQAELIRETRELNERIRNAGGSGGPIELRAAAPEWLSSGAPIHLGGGGPGSHPRPYRTSVSGDVERPGRKKWKVKPPAAIEHVVGTSGGAGVDVVILDTAPGPHDMARAYTTWRDDHTLVRRLLGPASPLSVTYASYADLLELEDYGLRGHRYEMTDHGLFVAGIVHSIAPEARLDLIEVLNPYGVGTTRTIGAGLREAQRRAIERRRPMVVNCSLVIYTPRPEDLDRLKYEDPDAWGGYSESSFAALCAELDDDLRVQIEDACAGLHANDVLVVAAAGNDAVGSYRPPARFPAAFNQVVGVGALDPDDLPAPYSNISDDPAPQVKIVASFGGAIDAAVVSGARGAADDDDELAAAEDRAMLGIYIGDFPPRRGSPNPRNIHGWAWWSGTSFAAPTISGTLATLRSPAGPNRTAHAALAEVMGVATQPTDLAGEFVFEGKQE
jgi:hypothetical protein